MRGFGVMAVMRAARRRSTGVAGLLAVLCLLAGLAGLVGVAGAGPAGADQAESVARRVAAASITAGADHTCALLATGRVRCWGDGGFGQLGHDSPTDVGDGSGPSIEAAGNVPLGGTAVAIAAGESHTCALLATGRVRCWGDGQYGRLGHDATTNIGDGSGPSIKAAGDVPLGGTAVAIAAGSAHTCALLTTGRVRCWGVGSDGQLGHNTTTNIGDGVGSDPSILEAGDVPLGGTAVAITAGDAHTCALLTTGKVRCWGYGGDGELGHDDTTSIGDGSGPSIKAAGDVPVGGTAVAIAAGDNHTCALLTTGRVRCWGYGGQGQLGHDSKVSIGDGSGPSITDSAAGNVPVGGTAVAITAGEAHTCALLTSGTVRCWGFGFLGQLGHDSQLNIGDGVGSDLSIREAGDVPLGGTAVAITAGRFHTCALLTTRAVRCWGQGANGRLGHDNQVSIGDGAADPSIAAAGDVPVGARARARATTRVGATVRPHRDRHAPYVYRVTGHVRGRFVADMATCTGRVKVTVSRGGHLLQRRTTRLGPRCGYRVRLELTGARLPLHRTTRLTVRIHFHGSRNLTAATTTRHVRAH